MAAMVESSDHTLLRIVPGLLEEGEPPLPILSTQRARCIPMLDEHCDTLFRQLPPMARANFVDNQAPLASQWLSAIPYNTFHLLSGQEIAVGLTHRTLTTGHNPVCRHCALANTLGHEEVCARRQALRTARHEGIKKTLAYHLRTVAGTEVHVEPLVQGQLQDRLSAERTDLRITGPASYQQVTSDYDVSITTINSQVYVVPLQNQIDNKASTTAAIKKVLDSKAAAKNRKYAGRTPAAFHPIIMSSSGTLSTSTAAIFRFWQEILPGPTYRSLMLSMGISLLRARARVFVL